MHAYGRLPALTILLLIAMKISLGVRCCYEIHNIVVLLTRA
jgi:hypothetical protein